MIRNSCVHMENHPKKNDEGKNNRRGQNALDRNCCCFAFIKRKKKRKSQRQQQTITTKIKEQVTFWMQRMLRTRPVCSFADSYACACWERNACWELDCYALRLPYDHTWWHDKMYLKNKIYVYINTYMVELLSYTHDRCKKVMREWKQFRRHSAIVLKKVRK